MSLAIVYSRATVGIAAPLVTVEAHLGRGMAGLNIVGLPETAVKESKDRVRSAIQNSQLEFPVRRITINLAPADLPKEGGRFDLPIALGILAASGQIPLAVLPHYEFVGELALSGELRQIRGVLPVVMQAHRVGRCLIVPKQNASEAALASQVKMLHASHLLDVVAYLQDKATLPICVLDEKQRNNYSSTDFSDVRGQATAKRALEVAAGGGHSLLFIGPPGTGKTMLASRLPTILPEVNDDEALEIAAVASVSHHGFDLNAWKQIPFRAPHHSSSSIALVGGGRPPRPGEISLAHHGILFLDELPEFSRHVLECLREPLELGYITISRAAFQTVFPAQFQLIAAMNPCPCGYAGSEDRDCDCTVDQIKRYRNKISGPLLDRIDMHVVVARLAPEALTMNKVDCGESSREVRDRVINARAIQMARQKKCNARLTVAEFNVYCQLSQPSLAILNQVMSKFNLSARVYHRIVKLARTIADLVGSAEINDTHIGEALQFRCLDREKKY